MTLLNDSVLGRLELENLDVWRGSFHSELFGREIDLEVEGPDEPSPEARELFAQYVEREIMLQGQIADAVFDYYEGIYPVYQEAWGDDADPDILPEPTNPADIWSMVYATTLRIPSQEDEPGTLRILFETPWDEEQGLEVKITDWRIEDVNIQGDT